MKRVLVVEDESRIARLVRDYLEHAGFEVAVAGDGEVAAKVGWDRVERGVGTLMEPQGPYPERYRVRSFPSDEQLSGLAGAS